MKPAIVAGIIALANHKLRLESLESYKEFLSEEYIEVNKIKEAINKKIKEHDNGDCNYDALCELLKELGL